MYSFKNIIIAASGVILPGLCFGQIQYRIVAVTPYSESVEITNQGDRLQTCSINWQNANRRSNDVTIQRGGSRSTTVSPRGSASVDTNMVIDRSSVQVSCSLHISEIAKDRESERQRQAQQLAEAERARSTRSPQVVTTNKQPVINQQAQDTPSSINSSASDQRVRALEEQNAQLNAQLNARLNERSAEAERVRRAEQERIQREQRNELQNTTLASIGSNLNSYEREQIARSSSTRLSKLDCSGSLSMDAIIDIQSGLDAFDRLSRSVEPSVNLNTRQIICAMDEVRADVLREEKGELDKDDIFMQIFPKLLQIK